MSRCRFLAFVSFLLLLGTFARAQDVGTEVTPDLFGNEARYKVHPKFVIYPLALATTLAFDTTAWATIQISTATPAKPLSNLMSHGYYKLEVFQLLLMAVGSKTPLKELVDQRDKGKSLRDIATGVHMDYDKVYDQSLVLDARVQKLLARITSVSSDLPSSQPPLPPSAPPAVPPVVPAEQNSNQGN